MLIKQTRTDLAETISRELEYQIKRGMTPRSIEVSPEAHEALRLLEGAPAGAKLRKHDNVDVIISPKFIGPRSFRINYVEGARATEVMRDAAVKRFAPPPSLILANR